MVLNLAVYSVGKKADCLETMKVAYWVDTKADCLGTMMVVCLVDKLAGKLAGLMVEVTAVRSVELWVAKLVAR